MSSAGVVDLLGILKLRGAAVGELDRGVVGLRGDRGPIDIGRSLGLSASKPSFSAAIVRNDSECG